MIRRYILIYFICITIPLFLGIVAWQSVRFTELDRSTRRLEAAQEQWVENNNRQLAVIAVLRSSARIEQVAVQYLGLSRIRPEEVLQVMIDE